MDEYNHVMHNSRLTVEKIGEEMYKATLVDTHARSVNGIDWEEKSIESSAISDIKDKAIQDVVLTIMVYLESLDGDVFSERTIPPERLN